MTTFENGRRFRLSLEPFYFYNIRMGKSKNSSGPRGMVDEVLETSSSGRNGDVQKLVLPLLLLPMVEDPLGQFLIIVLTLLRSSMSMCPSHTVLSIRFSSLFEQLSVFV